MADSNEKREREGAPPPDGESVVSSGPPPGGTAIGVEVIDPGLLIEIVRRRDSFIQAATAIALRATRPHEWTKFGEKYMPQIGAAVKIAERFGVESVNHKHEKVFGSDEKGEYYVYIWEADYQLVDSVGHKFASYHAVGTTTSRDQFFAVRDGNLRPLYEVSEDNILKAAKSNCDVRGITGLLGLRSVNEQDLADAGLDTGKVAAVKYKESGSKEETVERGEVVYEWEVLYEFEKARGNNPDETLGDKYLRFSKPGRDGSTFADMKRVRGFRTKGQIGWLKGACKAAYRDMTAETKAAVKAFKAGGTEEKKEDADGQG